MPDGLELIDMLPTPAIIVDGGGELLMHNKPAERHFGACLKNAGRCQNDPCTLNAVLEAVRKAIPKSLADGRLVLEIHGDPPCHVLGQTLIREEKSQYLLLLFADSFRFLIEESALSRLYGLTASEAKLVALLICSDASPKTMAGKLSVSINTIRTHLKRVYSKLGVSGQAGLIRRILLGPGLYLTSSAQSPSRASSLVAQQGVTVDPGKLSADHPNR